MDHHDAAADVTLPRRRTSLRWRRSAWPRLARLLAAAAVIGAIIGSVG